MNYVVIPVTHYQQNCSLVWCERTGKAVVIDPGGDLALVQQAIVEHNVAVQYVLLTHGHFDHAGHASELAERLSVPVWGPHKEDAFWLQSLPIQAQRMGFEPVPAFTPERWLEEGDQINVGDVCLQVLHCPGHTPGHIVFVDKASLMAWVGDVIFAGSVGRTDFPRGDMATLVNSIRSKLWALGDNMKFLPGHGPMSSIGRERQTNPFVADHRFG